MFSSAASVARREGPASQAAVAGTLRIVGVRNKQEESSAARAHLTFTVKVAPIALSQASKSPNKAPEPTTMAVTPRAISRLSEMKPANLNRPAARGAPATVVAHL